MRTETLRKILWVAAATLWLASVTTGGLLLGTDSLSARPAAAPDAERLVPAPAATTRAAVDYSVIWSRIKVAAAPATAAAAMPPMVAAVPMPVFNVLATFCEDEKASCYAVIRDQTAKQRLAGVGDKVGGGRIVRISTEGVTVEAGGRESLVKLAVADPGRTAPGGPRVGYRNAIALSSPPAPVPPTPTMVQAPAPAAPAPMPAGPASVPSPTSAAPPAPVVKAAEATAAAPAPTVGDPYTVKTDELKSYVRNLAVLLSQVKLSEHKNAKGAVDGLRIDEMLPTSVAAQRGLKEGDIIKKVYNVPMTQMGLITHVAYAVLHSAPHSVTTVIERNGAEQELVYDLIQAAPPAAPAAPATAAASSPSPGV